MTPYDSQRRGKRNGRYGTLFIVWLGAILLVWLVAIIAIACAETHNNRMSGVSSMFARIMSEETAANSKSPVALEDVTTFLTSWIAQLHNEDLAAIMKNRDDPSTVSVEDIWQVYHNLTVQQLHPWDQEYLKRMPSRRHDGSIFLSVATYRDRFCFDTLQEAYRNAKHPEKLHVGLVQQNCQKNCYSGFMGPERKPSRFSMTGDPDCYAKFCNSAIGQPYCENQQVRVLQIDESESLGPHMARYFASKLWYGEEWYIQIDAHMTFAEHWDAITLKGLANAPSEKPVLSHYPPAHTVDLNANAADPPARICDLMFSPKTIRLVYSKNWDIQQVDTPRFSPVVGAGFLAAPSSILKDVPFDPFLPWIFIGEEIILSSRLWTSGYDFFSPQQAVIGHNYQRQNEPRFWESMHHLIAPSAHELLEELVVSRINHQLGFPEAAKDAVPKEILSSIEDYSMGTVRSLDDYMKFIGVDVTRKEITRLRWCEDGMPPPGLEHLKHLYNWLDKLLKPKKSWVSQLIGALKEI